MGPDWPRCLLTIEPKLGLAAGFSAKPVNPKVPASGWPPANVTCDRTTVNKLLQLASLGRSSVSCKPGVRVLMDEKGPRTSLGASGSGSKVSIWLGALAHPKSQTKITDLAFPLWGVLAKVARAGAETPTASGKDVPRRRNARRFRPPHVCAVNFPTSTFSYNF